MLHETLNGMLSNAEKTVRQFCVSF